MTNRGPFQPLPFCDSAGYLKKYVILNIRKGRSQSEEGLRE